MSRITEIPAADPTTARTHYAARLALETDADDVAEALASGRRDFVLLDARSPRAFAAGHLPGARSLPHAAIDAAAVAALPAGALVVYCWGPGCNAAHKAGLRLAAHGRTAKEMLGGWEYFVREGHPVEGGRAFARDGSGLVAVG